MPGTLLKNNSIESLRNLSQSPAAFVKNASMTALNVKGNSIADEKGSLVRGSGNLGPTTASINNSPSKTLLHGQGSQPYLLQMQGSTLDLLTPGSPLNSNIEQ